MKVLSRERRPAALRAVSSGGSSGFLLIADISGYTTFMRQIELDHAHDIITSLLEAIIDGISGAFDVMKLEGDAVFAVSTRPLASTDLIGCVDGAYAAFRKLVGHIGRASSCECRACRSVGALDLKFVLHHGEWVAHQVAGRSELAGPDVITVHRLLKNKCESTTGVRAYLLMTVDAARDAGVDPLSSAVATYSEDVDGEQRDVVVVDIAERWERLVSQTQIYVSDDDATRSSVFLLPAPLPAAWGWLNSPERRPQWNPTTYVGFNHPSGVPGVGTVSHCVHGLTRYDEEILDWRPFDYVTYRLTLPVGQVLFTFEFRGAEDGSTLMTGRMREDGRSTRERVLMRALVPPMWWRYKRALSNLCDLLADEEARPRPAVALSVGTR